MAKKITCVLLGSFIIQKLEEETSSTRKLNVVVTQGFRTVNIKWKMTSPVIQNKLQSKVKA